MLTKTKSKRKAKSLSQLKKQAWDLLSQCIRREYAHKNNGVCDCYTCPATLAISEAQAGHAIGGRHNAVLFDEEILRIQCCGCNVFKRGNYQIFITKLIEENGFAWWQAKLAASKLTIKYNRADLEARIESYKARLAEVG
jgi:hypothetical protein